MSLHQHIDRKALTAACILSAAGALVFNAFPLFLTALAEQFALNDEQLGILGSAYLSGFALVALFSVIWMSRVSWRRTGWLAYAMIAAGVVGFSLAESVSHLITAMIILGIGSGVIFTIALGIMAASKDPDRAYGFKLSTEMLLAAVLMFGMTTLVINKFGYTGFIIAIAAIYMLTSLSIYWLPASNFLAVEEQQTTLSTMTHNTLPVWMAVVALFIQFAAFSGLWGFMGRIGEVNGLNEEDIGALLSLSVLAGLAGAILGAWLGNRVGQLKPMLMIFSLTIATCLLLINNQSIWSFAVATCLINALLQLAVIYQMGLVTALDSSGKFTVMLAFILASGGAVGPILMGMLIENHSLDHAYLAAIIATLCSILLTTYACRSSQSYAPVKCSLR